MVVKRLRSGDDHRIDVRAGSKSIGIGEKRNLEIRRNSFGAASPGNSVQDNILAAVCDGVRMRPGREARTQDADTKGGSHGATVQNICGYR